MAKKAAKRPKKIELIATVDPVTVINPVWINAAGVWTYKVTVRATIVPPNWPPGATAMSRQAKLQRWDSSAWTDITLYKDMTIVSGNLWEAEFNVPGIEAPVGATLQGYVKVMWQATWPDLGDSPSHTVINRP